MPSPVNLAGIRTQESTSSTRACGKGYRADSGTERLLALARRSSETSRVRYRRGHEVYVVTERMDPNCG